MTVFKSLKGVNFQISYKYLLQSYVKKNNMDYVIY